MTSVFVTGSVMAHPSRIEMAHELVQSAGPDFLGIAVDPEPTGPPTALRTSIVAWSSIPDRSTHHLVLEDDAVLSEGFVEHVRRIATLFPNDAVGFYANWNGKNGAAVRLGALLGARWVGDVADPAPTVALLLPSEIGRGFPAYAHEHGETWPDDVVMQRYLMANGVSIYLTVPNIVDHRTLPSIAGNLSHGLRVSACHLPMPPDTDWGRQGLRNLSVVPFSWMDISESAVKLRRKDRWRTVPTRQYGELLGLDPAECRSDLNSALRSWSPDQGSVLARLPTTSLERFWEMMYLIGGLSRRKDHFPDVGQQFQYWSSSPVADQALGTFGPGGICTTDLDISTYYGPLKSLARQALYAGARRLDIRDGDPARHITHGARLARRALVVVCDHDLLRDFIVADMTDRGYSVRGFRPADLSHTQAVCSALEGAEAAVFVEDLVPTGIDGDSRRTSLTLAYDLLMRHSSRQGVRSLVRLFANGCSEVSSDVMSHQRDSGTGPLVTSLRIGELYGPEIGIDLPINALVRRSVMRQRLNVAELFPEPRQVVHIWDLADALSRVLRLHPRSPHFDICVEDCLAPDELGRAIGEVVYVVNDVDDVTQTAAPTPVGSGNRLFPDHAREELGWSPRMSLELGIKTVAEWVGQHADIAP